VKDILRLKLIDRLGSKYGKPVFFHPEKQQWKIPYISGRTRDDKFPVRRGLTVVMTVKTWKDRISAGKRSVIRLEFQILRAIGRMKIPHGTRTCSIIYDNMKNTIYDQRIEYRLFNR
jgi:hypothetical protein